MRRPLAPGARGGELGRRIKVAKHNSLSEYALRRFRLAGKALLQFHDPFFAPTDRLRAEFEAKGTAFRQLRQLRLSRPGRSSADQGGGQSASCTARRRRAGLAAGRRRALDPPEVRGRHRQIPRRRGDAVAGLRLSDESNCHHASDGAGARRAVHLTSCRTTASSPARAIPTDPDRVPPQRPRSSRPAAAEQREKFRNVLIVVESLYSHGRRHGRPAAPGRDQGKAPGLAAGRRGAFDRRARRARRAACAELRGVDPNRIDLDHRHPVEVVRLLRRLRRAASAA